MHAIHFKPQVCRDEQVDSHNVVREFDGIVNLNWQYKIEVPNEYVASRHKFVQMLTQFENVWDGHVQSTKAVQHLMELKNSKHCPMHSAPNRAGPESRDFEREETKRMLAMNAIELAQTK